MPFEYCSSGPLFCYIRTRDRSNFESTLDRAPAWILGNVHLVSGITTDMDGYWNRQLQYIGCKKVTLYFYIGEEDGWHYYEYIHYIDVDRFFINTYKGQSGRDFCYLPSGWDWNRPKKFPKSSKTKAA